MLGQAGAAGRPLDDQPHRQAGASDEHHRQYEVGDLDRARQRVGERLGDGEEDDEDGAGDGDGAEDQQEVAAGDVAPPLLVEPEGGEDDELADDDEADRLHEEDLVAVRQAVGVVEEPQLEGEEVGEGDERRVGHHLQNPVAIDGVVQPAHESGRV